MIGNLLSVVFFEFGYRQRPFLLVDFEFRYYNKTSFGRFFVWLSLKAFVWLRYECGYLLKVIFWSILSLIIIKGGFLSCL